MKLHKGKFIVSTIMVCLTIFFSTTYSKENTSTIEKPTLKFGSDGNFKIVQFADSQDGAIIDPRTVDLMNKILDYEKPNLVVLTGDNIDGKCKSARDVKEAINSIAGPMEKRGIPWAVVFGNHDEEHGMMSKEEMMKLYMSYAHNISEIGFKDNTRVGNYNLLIKGSKSDIPAFNIYMLDSGKYSSDMQAYEWIKENQIAWYKDTYTQLKVKYNNTIPALMFFHIPLPEWKVLWNSGTAIGERNEEECSPTVNSGLFKELVAGGDVKGVFVGHDHVNDYVGKLQGITLGYSRSIGYGTYGKEGFSRGARVFSIKESEPTAFKTWMRLEEDF
jgi:predicted MPP superfamily phosphohydrolase